MAPGFMRAPALMLICPQTQQQKFVNWQGDAEFKGDDFTAAVTFGNPDVLAGSGTASRTQIRWDVGDGKRFFSSTTNQDANGF